MMVWLSLMLITVIPRHENSFSLCDFSKAIFAMAVPGDGLVVLEMGFSASRGNRAGDRDGAREMKTPKTVIADLDGAIALIDRRDETVNRLSSSIVDAKYHRTIARYSWGLFGLETREASVSRLDLGLVFSQADYRSLTECAAVFDWRGTGEIAGCRTAKSRVRRLAFVLRRPSPRTLRTDHGAGRMSRVDKRCRGGERPVAENDIHPWAPALLQKIF